MISVKSRDLQKNVRACLDTAQKDYVVITRDGDPAAVLIGVEGQSWETVVLETNPAFWNLIEKRRRQKTIPLAVMRRKFR